MEQQVVGAITLIFCKSDEFEIIATCRNLNEATDFTKQYSGVDFRELDAKGADVSAIAEAIKGAEWVVNAIGIIKPYIHDDNPEEVETAIRVNALFPHFLGQAAEQTGAKVIQIATDCVYSGEKGGYVETDAHDALDVYGKSKSLGEAH